MENSPVAFYTSSLNITYSIVNFKTISNTDIFSLVLKKYLDLVDAKLADAVIPITNASSVLCLYHNDEVVAFTVYTVLKETRTLWKNFTYVNSEYRRQGLANYLNNAIETIAKRSECVRIQSHVHVNNTGMIQCNLSSGLEQQYIKFNKNVSS